MSSSKPFVVALVGPTATGKTAFAVRLARAQGGEVVSCDSMQVYQNMAIGTAVPTPEERQGVPHHMLELIPPGEPYSVADYCRDAALCIGEILSRGHLPIVAGGTGLYLDSLLGGLSFDKMPGEQALRAELRRQAQELGGQAMLERLWKVDPTAAQRLHQNDHKRIIRALEVYHSTGLTLSELSQRARGEPRYNVLWLGLDYRDRAALYRRIEQRVERMMRQGLAEEARLLAVLPGVEKGTALQAIGHKELLAQGGEPERAAESIKQATRRYAKRQQTWFRKNPRIVWYYRDEQEDEAILADMLNRIDLSRQTQGYSAKKGQNPIV